MADTKGQNEAPVKEPQDSAMPTDDQKTVTPESAQPDVGKTQAAGEETAGLPEDAKERTRQEFEKLQIRLREEREKREALERAFQTMQTPKVEEPTLPPVIDPNTGLPNETALTDAQRRAYEAEQRAKRAEVAVQQYMEDQENRQTYAVHPELDPNSTKFDKKLHVATRQILLDSMLNPQDYGNKQLSFLEAANFAKGLTPSAVEKAKEEGAKEALEKLTPKEQASLEATGTSGRRTEVESDLETLQWKTRKGGREGEQATYERLRRLGKSGG